MNDTFLGLPSADFLPHPLLASGHAQTIFAGLATSKKIPHLGHPHTIPTTDGDQLVVHEDRPDGWCEGDLCTLLVHGLGGSHRSPYIARLANKLRAYSLQDDENQDTVEANLSLGFQADHRDYGVGAQILRDLGIRRLRLMTNNMGKYVALKGFGLEIVERVPLEPEPSEENRHYLRTKKNKMGHILKSV